MKKNILVFPCGSEIGLDIYQLVKYSTYFHLIGGNSVDDHGKFVYEDYIGDIPFIDTDLFIPTVKQIVKERNIDAIYPATDAAITILKQNEDILDCKIIAPDKQITEICLSKETTYKKLRGIVQIPEVYDTNYPLEYPVFIKPKIGYGSRGAKVIHNIDELKSEENLSSKLITEYLPGKEYTVDCFSNRKGKLLFSAARERSRIRAGISVHTEFVSEQSEFRTLAEKINEAIGFRGAWFFQVKRNKKGEPVLMEIAARFGGSSLLCAAVGANFAQLTLFDAFGYDVEINQNSYQVEMDRAFSSKYKHNLNFSCVYVDFDDCLYLDKSALNTELIAFLYACLNKGIKIILITKHDGDLNKKLTDLRIKDLFDSIIHISVGEEKHDFITETDSIFIDDSYMERKKIAQFKKIPVFSPEMISVLL